MESPLNQTNKSLQISIQTKMFEIMTNAGKDEGGGMELRVGVGWCVWGLARREEKKN